MKREITFFRRDYSKIAMIIPLFFIIMPRPNMSAVQFLTYPLIVFLICLLVLNLTKDIKVNKNVFLVFVFMFFVILEMVVSMLINAHLDVNGVAKQVLIGAVLYFGYFISNSKDTKTIKNSLLKLAYVIIIIQSIVGITQLFGIDLFSVLYSSEKARALGGIVRITGTLANPNMFAWVLIQMMVLIWLFEKKISKRASSLVFVTCLVFLSGSRSMLLIFPFVILMIEIITKKKTPAFFFIKTPIYGLILFASYKMLIWFLTTFGENFRYMQRLLTIFETKDLSSDNSFEHRSFMWERAMSNINSYTDWLFGTGGAIEKADNDYVFAVSNYGISYLVIQLSMYILIGYFFLKLKDKKFSALGIQYIVFSLVLGYQVETLSGWNYPILIMFYTGIAISILANKNVANETEKSLKTTRTRGLKIGKKRLVW